MNLPPHAALLPLGNTGLTLSDPSQDLRGYPVKDMHGQEIGEVEDLLIDDTEKRVRFLLVSSGGFLGIGQERFLIPVDAITRIHKGHVHVARALDQVASGPRYDPRLTLEDQQPRLAESYAYYGFPPFWAAGYAYPGFSYRV